MALAKTGPSPIPSLELAELDAIDLLPTSLFSSSLAATLHPGSSGERVGSLSRHRSPDDLGFVPNPGSRSFPSVATVFYCVPMFVLM